VKKNEFISTIKIIFSHKTRILYWLLLRWYTYFFACFSWNLRNFSVFCVKLTSFGKSVRSIFQWWTPRIKCFAPFVILDMEKASSVTFFVPIKTIFHGVGLFHENTNVQWKRLLVWETFFPEDIICFEIVIVIRE
jgi:hypothetical protein